MEQKEIRSFNFLNLISNHPYISTILFCFLLLPFGFCNAAFMSKGCIIYGSCLFVLFLAILLLSNSIVKGIKWKLISLMSMSILVFAITINFLINEFSTIILCLLLLVVVCILFLLMSINNTLTINNIIILLILAGIIIRFTYVLTTDSNTRQHDVGQFQYLGGHAGYIEWWYQNGLKLPNFDVRNYWQYYHPPLHHMLMALLLKILTVLGVEYSKATSAIQILPMIYSSLCMVISYKIFTYFKLKKLPLIISMMIVCFHPTFIILSGSYNNDILSVLFVLLAILATLKWYDNPSIKTIIPIALSVGFGMMTKLSVWMIAPAIAFLFLVKLIQTKKYKKYIFQFFVFGIICIPLALWWQTRNLIAFNVPITYIPDLGTGSDQYVGNISFINRLFDFSLLSYVFAGFPPLGAPYYEVNPTLGLFKTALFDEGNHAINSTNFPKLETIGPLLFWIGTILALITFVCFILAIIKKNPNISYIQKWFLIFIFFTFLIFYYYFCYSYPYSCTMNIRYCTPLIQLCSLGLGVTLQNIKNKQLKPVVIPTISILTIIFSTLSVIEFMLII